MKRKASNNTSGDEQDLVDTLLNYEEANKPEFHLTTNQIKAVAMVRLQREQFQVAPIWCRYRICPGISFATSNIGLAQLLYRFNWKLPNDAKLEALDMAENFGIIERRRNNLHVIATTHIPFHK
ncbi:hypothetical protein Pyn_28260 [Prunus yedoensis var. nudiflora]|uniref:Uncharacterized protein n=1 Tax=Prunus yedoensis var. nudiflora TaxID=2094558 RepID=A0A314ZMJ6_PRUYE|nr:hypothetical protein Pyn_28260 [Prunus yedoensis var. nudiflora]